jgi:hypothetical protein
MFLKNFEKGFHVRLGMSGVLVVRSVLCFPVFLHLSLLSPRCLLRSVPYQPFLAGVHEFLLLAAGLFNIAGLPRRHWWGL